jgi:hypothetical protein
MSVSLTKLTTDLNAHQNLADQPTLTASELKIAWDKPSNDIKTYINNILIPEAEAGYTSTINEAKAYTDTNIAGIDLSSDNISYDNTSSGLTADNVQDAIDEINTKATGIDSRVTSIETSISNPLIHLEEYDITIEVAQGYGTHTTRTLPDVEGYTFIGCTYPYCQHSCSCSISSIDGKVITVEGFNGGGGNPRIHFNAMYMKMS